MNRDAETHRLRMWLSAGVIVSAMYFAMLAYIETRGQPEMREGIRCLVLQFSEHRQANENAHRAGAGAGGYTYNVDPDYGPPPIPADLIDACQPFYGEQP